MAETVDRNGLDRRSFLAAAGAAGLAAFVAPKSAAQVRGRVGGLAKNLIFMVSDGMSIGAYQLADRLHEMENGGRHSRWAELMRHEGARTVLAMTHSANSEVTDSAAASSAWSIGERCNNGVISMTTEGKMIEPIWIRAKRGGRGTALVTTSRVTHATPAAFAANIDQRNKEDEIAEQLIKREIDVVLGGGARHFPDALLDRDDVLVVRTAGELEAVRAADSGRVVGLFKDEHMSYDIDRGSDEPSLAAMTSSALERMMSRFPDGFVMQVEAARVDHAAHACDSAGIVRDQLAFDGAVGEVLDWAADRDDTLVIVTTDHGNASPNLTLYGDESKRGMELLEKARGSFESLWEELGDLKEMGEGDAGRVGDAIERVTAVRLSEEEVGMVLGAAKRERMNAFKAMRRTHHVLGSVLANHTGINFVSGNHTAEQVIATAVGPGADRVPAVGHLTDMHRLMVDVLGLPVAREM